MSKITEIEDEVKKDVVLFIDTAEHDLITIAQSAYAWVQHELSLLAPEVLADLKGAVQSAAAEAVSKGLNAGTTGTVVTDTLNILARDGMDILAQVKSDVITAVVGLVTAPKVPPA